MGTWASRVIKGMPGWFSLLVVRSGWTSHGQANETSIEHDSLRRFTY